MSGWYRRELIRQEIEWCRIMQKIFDIRWKPADVPKTSDVQTESTGDKCD